MRAFNESLRQESFLHRHAWCRPARAATCCTRRKQKVRSCRRKPYSVAYLKAAAASRAGINLICEFEASHRLRTQTRRSFRPWRGREKLKTVCQHTHTRTEAAPVMATDVIWEPFEGAVERFAKLIYKCMRLDFIADQYQQDFFLQTTPTFLS